MFRPLGDYLVNRRLARSFECGKSEAHAVVLYRENSLGTVDVWRENFESLFLEIEYVFGYLVYLVESVVQKTADKLFYIVFFLLTTVS